MGNENFIDYVKIFFRSGDGGSGSSHLQRTKQDPKARIQLHPDENFQQIDGFGVAITGSTCYNLLKMTKENRAALLNETFHPVKGMGYSEIRIAIGCSDFSLDEYTCCDKPGIENFAIHELDKRDLFPVLREILAINPAIKILASPWTPPRWMDDSCVG